MQDRLVVVSHTGRIHRPKNFPFRGLTKHAKCYTGKAQSLEGQTTN